jgi:putative peptidoglycan lipid II flippase
MMSTEPRPRARSAAFVAAGILLSRISGLIRQHFFARYFGLQSDAADAFSAAFRIPNFLQNLFGEGALSASFIPVYAALLARDAREEADRVARAVASILALVVAVLVLAGVLATPFLIDAIAPGFHGAKRDLTIQIVRILFPGTGLLVMSAWCLGVLNSHRRFLLSYSAPVMWNAAMIGTLVAFGPGALPARLAILLAWGSVIGSALQFVVQVPAVLHVAPGIATLKASRYGSATPPDGSAIRDGSATLSGSRSRADHVRTVVRNFAPVFVSRGVVQLSAYIDTLIASWLPTGAVAGLSNATLLYTLPVSLFGMSVSAAELPEMSGALTTESAGAEAVRRRLNTGLRQIAYFVVPSAVAFVALGDVIAAALFRSGRFTADDVRVVWGILVGSSIGLLASTLGRLYSSTYYALRDTRTPLRYALVRVALTTVLGYLCAIPLPRALGIAGIWGAAGLTGSAGLAGWVEMLMLRHTLNNRIGRTGLPMGYTAKLWTAAIAAGAVGLALKVLLPSMGPVPAAVLILGPYGVVFIALTRLLRVPEATLALTRLRAR